MITLDVEAAHQPEKDGAENVVRMLPGVKSVVNNLKVKPELAGGSIKVNPAEAKLLEEEMQRQAQESQNIAPPAATPNAQVEAECQGRELLAIKQREEEAALRQAAEEKLRREAAEQERRKMLWTSGRGQIDLVQQPSAPNGYTTIIRLDD